MMCLGGKKRLNKTSFLVCLHQWNLHLWMYKHSSISFLTLFVDALPTVEAEQEEDGESPWDSEVLFVKDTRVSTAGSRSKIQTLENFPLIWTLLLIRPISSFLPVAVCL